VTFGRRQEAIERLLRYDVRRVVFTLRREANRFDQNAVAVDVTVIGKGTVQIGYLPRTVAQLLAHAIDKGCCPVVYDWQVIGEQTHGLRLSLSLVPGLLTKAAGTPAAKQMGARVKIGDKIPTRIS
ncbi:MAG: HIRAN domain-containing protein, partial [Alicyclobacillaceae bacterium]|nr:HIRAN domain-containing protein [Alicyclobacillaceae bacterium]